MIFGEALYFIALAAAVVVFRFAPGRLRPWLIFICGLSFYGYYAGRFWLLILGEALLVYVLGKVMRRPRVALPAFLLGLAGTIGALAYFKYSRLLGPILGQALGTHAGTLPTFQDIAVPLAISFFTFEFIHYIVDIRRGTIERHSLGDFLAFAMFAPTMVAGPIKRFQQFSPQVKAVRADAGDVSAGITRIAVGLAKKMVLADTFTLWLGPLGSTGSLDQASKFQIVSALVAYSLHIYFDFSGYSDIAIGSARLFGITVPENFSWPYLRSSIQSFWRHWHMSLTRWVTDYIYIPLGGNRRGLVVTCLNLMVAFTIVGIWHGAAWHFAAWGAFNGLLLVGHRLWSELGRKPLLAAVPSLSRGAAGKLLHYAGSAAGGLFTFALVTLGWGLFVMPYDRFWHMLERLL
ncbi:MAG TPA: MBOAT family O-acyltransferase [Gaiellaceae bacterium]